MTIHITPNNPQYRIVEIFESLQGEGWNTGMPAVFIRLGNAISRAAGAIPTTLNSA